MIPTNIEDSFDNMQRIAKNNFSFPYLLDETQEIAKYGAVCTPIFGYNNLSNSVSWPA